MSVPHKQDMPPSGGYNNINVKRLPTWTPKCIYSNNFFDMQILNIFIKLKQIFNLNIKFLFLFKASWIIAGCALLIPLGVWDYKTRKNRNMYFEQN